MKTLKFKLGADPEFAIILQDKLVPAEKLLKTLFATERETSMGFRIKNAGVLGWDGSSNTGEIRPSPSNNVDKLVANIKTLFAGMTEKTELFGLSTLSDKAPIGGHIHFELPDNKTSSTNVQIIHKKMMSFYIPVMLGENNMNLRMRTKQGYGKITEHRVQKFGSKYTYEFRVPTAEWLTTPKIAKATLCYLACIYNEIMNKPENFKKNKNLITKNEAQANALQTLTMSNFDTITSILTNKIKKTIKNFELFEDFKEEINFILSPKKILKEKERYDYNIILGWGLTNKNNPTKRALLSEKQLKEKSMEIDLDSFTRLITVQSNPDECIDVFIRAIKHRIVALNWKLSNNYFLFGLKKGIKDPIIKNKTDEFLYGQKQIKTRLDLTTIDNTFGRMESRFRTSSNNSKPKQQIIIGLPYEMRIKQDVKSLIDLIHSVEKNIFLPQVINKTKLIDDTAPKEFGEKKIKRGNIFKVYSTEASEPITLEDSTSRDTLRIEAEQERDYEENGEDEDAGSNIESNEEFFENNKL